MAGNVEKLRKTLSANIKKYRAELRLSQEKLAEAVGLSDQTINDIEGCRSWVSDKTIVKIAQALKVEVYQLVYPQNEAEKICPVRVPTDVLLELRTNLESDLARRFDAVITE
jgi:transcriptional regulator with XRE-family HTH domain